MKLHKIVQTPDLRGASIRLKRISFLKEKSNLPRLVYQRSWQFPCVKKLMRNFFLSGFLLFCSACSFHSNQWELARTLLSNKDELITAEWLVELPASERFPAFAMTRNQETIFTDGQRWSLIFDGWHIVELNDLRERNEWKLTFESEGEVVQKCPSNRPCVLYYSALSGRRQSESVIQQCEAWRQLEGTGGYFKDCRETGRLSRNYQIDIDEGGLISRIMWSWGGHSGSISRISKVPYQSG